MLCKRALAEQRKHEAERLEAALRDQQRQIMRRSARPPSLVEKFLQTKWGDYFTVGAWSCERPLACRGGDAFTREPLRWLLPALPANCAHARTHVGA